MKNRLIEVPAVANPIAACPGFREKRIGNAYPAAIGALGASRAQPFMKEAAACGWTSELVRQVLDTFSLEGSGYATRPDSLDRWQVEQVPGKGFPKPLKPYVIRKHLLHDIKTACQLPDSSWLIALDLDAHTGSREEQQTNHRLLDLLKEEGIQAYVETSPRNGFHVFILLEREIPGHEGRRIVRTWLERHGLLKANVEIFTGTRKRLALPFWHGSMCHSLCEPQVEVYVKTPAGGVKAFELFKSIPKNSYDRIKKVMSKGSDAIHGSRGTRSLVNDRAEEKCLKSIRPNQRREKKKRKKKNIQLAVGLPERWLLKRIEAICPEGITEFGQRNEKAFLVIKELVKQAVHEDLILAAVFHWLKRHKSRSKDLQLWSDQEMIEDLKDKLRSYQLSRQEAISQMEWRDLEPDRRDIEALVASGLKKSVAKHAAKIMAAFRIKGLRVGDKMPLSQEWLRKVLEIQSNPILAAVREGLKKAEVVRAVRFASRTEGRAEIVEIRRVSFGTAARPRPDQTSKEALYEKVI